MNDSSPQKSLREELAKRKKTAQMQQHQKPISAPTPSPDVPVPAPQSVARETTTEPQGRSASARRIQTVSSKAYEPAVSRRKNLRPILILAAGSALLLVACLAVFIGATSVQNPIATAASTPRPMPIVAAADAFSYLQRTGLSVTLIGTFEPPDPEWGAVDGVRFEARQGSATGSYFLLGYADADDAAGDQWKASVSGQYRQWQVTAVSNIVLAANPGSDAKLTNAIISHLVSYLLAPVVELFPTSTGPFIGAAPTDEMLAATARYETAVAQNQLALMPTVNSILVTVTPRPPSETPTASSTATARPSRTPTLVRTLTPSRAPILLSTPVPNPTRVLPTVTSAANNAAVASSTPDRRQVEALTEALPSTVSDLQLLDGETATTDQSIVVNYRDERGREIKVVIWISESESAAVERFKIDQQSVPNHNTLPLADDAFIAAGPHLILGELRRRNVLVIVYNPLFLRAPGDTTSSAGAISPDEAATILQQIYNALSTRAVNPVLS